MRAERRTEHFAGVAPYEFSGGDGQNPRADGTGPATGRFRPHADDRHRRVVPVGAIAASPRRRARAVAQCLRPRGRWPPRCGRRYFVDAAEYQGVFVQQLRSCIVNWNVEASGGRKPPGRPHERETTMLIDFGKAGRPFGNSMTRRRMLRVGTSGLISGLTLPRLMQLEAEAATAETAPARACI